MHPFIKFIFISFCLFPSIIHAQKTHSKTKIGVSIRPSIYKDHFQFENHQVYDLAPTLILERKLNEAFSIKLNLQYRSWQKEFVQDRSHKSILRATPIHRKYKVLAPAIFISWQKKKQIQKLKGSPYINLGFSQHLQIFRQPGHPISIHSPELATQGFLVRSAHAILGFGMNFPINKKWSAFLEPQIAKSINSSRSSHDLDLGLMIGSTIAL